MRRLIFHIGQTKTGSSALQVFLAKNRSVLRDRSVDYLAIGGDAGAEKGKITSGNGARLLRNLTLKPGEPVTPEILGAREELLRAVRGSSCETGIVSSELFTGLGIALWQRFLKEITSLGLVVEIIYFIREQEQSLCSIYMQQVKRHRCTETPESYVAATYQTNTQLNYENYYNRFLPLFEPSQIRCLIYEEALRGPGGIFGAFLREASIPDETLDYAVTDVNNSLSPMEVGFMIALNRYSPRMSLSDLLVENSRDSGRMRSGNTHRLISSELSQQIYEFYNDSNSAFARKYFARDTLFEIPCDREANAGPLDFSVVDAAALQNILAGVLVRYDNRLAGVEKQLAKRMQAPGALDPAQYNERLDALERQIASQDRLAGDDAIDTTP